MALDEGVITKAIVKSYMEKLLSVVDLDVAIVGGGPSGLVAGYYLAKKGFHTALFEKRLSVGGGMWGGGMMFNQIVVQEEGKSVLDEFGVRTERFIENYYLADAVEAVTTIASRAVQAGLKVFNLISFEDVVVREGKVCGIVINWTSTLMAGIHVDPLTLKAKAVIDATGHDTEVVKVIEKKGERRLMTDTGKIVGEKAMWAELGEQKTLQNTREVYPGVFVCGMAANATFGSYRMGPIFGGMLLSGKKVAEMVSERLKAR